ncbi:bile acid:sodium symporter family protein [Ammoniphilus sp. 3BR4]|uniref:bile acid:sodium symporter family protein n=1 Tax=Ammoniphilus sp. 3BR4 TaxID=3158265 RepID=UPI0034675D9D
MLQLLNRGLEKAMPLITPVSVVSGVVLAERLHDYTFLVPWIFAFMTFAGSLSSDFRSLANVMLHPFPIFIAFLVLHIGMPLWAWSVGHIAFSGDALTITGLILGMVIPTGITSFIWVSIYRGNHALALSIILIDTLLSPLLVPFSLSVLVGEMVAIDGWGLMKGLLGMIVIPSLLGMLLNQMTKGKVKVTLSPRLAPFLKIGLGMVVMINSSMVSPYLIHVNWRLVAIACTVFFVSSTGYLLSWGLGKLLKWNREDIVSLVFTGGMRNVSAGAVMAVAYFPGAVAAPVVMAMLFQQILASLFGHLLARYYKTGHRKSNAAA